MAARKTRSSSGSSKARAAPAGPVRGGRSLLKRLPVAGGFSMPRKAARKVRDQIK
jgi:hypothetical protein